MRFEEIYARWNQKRLPQEQAAEISGISSRTLRRYISKYEEDGLDGLQDKRLTQASFRRAPVDEVVALVKRYESRYRGWNVSTSTRGISAMAGNVAILR
jgi:transposase